MFVKTLRELPFLETITLNTPFLDTTLFSLGVVFNTLTEAPSLSRIRSLSLAQEAHIRAYFEQLRTPQELRNKVVFSRSHFDDLMYVRFQSLPNAFIHFIQGLIPPTPRFVG